MNTIKHESHTRSILKGLSWRFVATLDTVLVVLLVTTLMGNPSLKIALAIGVSEFLIKLAVYYGHERVWDRVRPSEVTAGFTLKKSISWRVVATTMTFIISGVVLESFDQVALSIALVESITKFALYYAHERVWLRVPLGQVRHWFDGNDSKASSATK
jgi:uncharacterized membrane protein